MSYLCKIISLPSRGKAETWFRHIEIMNKWAGNQLCMYCHTFKKNEGI